LREALDALRVTKTPYEQWCLREANQRASAGHDAVRRAFEGGASTEFELHLAFLQATAQDDPETPYKNIVALGRNAATLHHVSYGKRPDEGAGGAQALLLDAGATCLGYCADITRTWVRGRGAAADLFTALVEGVDAMQQALCARAAVGRPYEALHDESHARLGALLGALGVLRGGAEEAVAAGVTRAFYPHGLGHSLGLQCHDVGCATVKPRADNPFLRNTSVIAPGQSFTVEPGVYFIESLLGPVREGPHRALVDWGLVDALTPLGGVRLEDDVVVREGAPVDNLTRPALPRGGGRV
jgi:Xaa-Pro dipeptidase